MSAEDNLNTDQFMNRLAKKKQEEKAGEEFRQMYARVEHGPEYADFRAAVPKMLAEHRTPAQRRAKFKVVE